MSRVKTAKKSSKFKIRNSKQIQMIKKPKIQNKFHSDSKFWNFRILSLFGGEFVSVRGAAFVLRISDLILEVCFDPRALFRYSDFGFSKVRIY